MNTVNVVFYGIRCHYMLRVLNFALTCSSSTAAREREMRGQPREFEKKIELTVVITMAGFTRRTHAVSFVDLVPEEFHRVLMIHRLYMNPNLDASVAETSTFLLLYFGYTSMKQQ